MVSRLEHILSRKKRREEKLRAALGSIVDQLRALGALKIVLFGSLARAEVDVGSDLDLLVIMPATRTGEEWTRLVYERLERGGWRRISSSITSPSSTPCCPEVPF